MSHELLVVSNPAELGEAVAERIVKAMEHVEPGDFLLGCPTGRTPTPVFRPLARLLATRRIDPTRLKIVLMDEYLTAKMVLVNPRLDYSCVGYAEQVIVAPIRQATGKEPSVWHVDPGDPGAYDRRIEEAGGIDLFLLASGASDGHLAFNQPGADRSSVTRIIELGEATRRDNVETWASLTSIEQVPTHGIGVGISTIADLSREAVMMLTGTSKRHAFDRIVTARHYEPDWPATAVTEIENHTIIAARQAAGQ